MPEDIKSIKEVLRKRKCPYCGEPIKLYIFSSVVIPVEWLAQEAVMHEEKLNAPYPFYFWLHAPNSMFARLLLSSTCACGNVSFWDCNKNYIKAITESDMQKDGYGINIFYSVDVLKIMLERADITFDKDMLGYLLKIASQGDADGSKD